MSSLKSLSREQFDRALPNLQNAARNLLERMPASGWIKSLRTLLGMSSSSLAHKLGIAHSGLLKLEKGELSGSITLGSLRRVADAMNADVVYAIVPRRQVAEAIHDRARHIARERVTSVAKSMQLEAQGLNSKQFERQVEDLARALETRPRELWR